MLNYQAPRHRPNPYVLATAIVASTLALSGAILYSSHNVTVTTTTATVSTAEPLSDVAEARRLAQAAWDGQSEQDQAEFCDNYVEDPELVESIFKQVLIDEQIKERPDEVWDAIVRIMQLECS